MGFARRGVVKVDPDGAAVDGQPLPVGLDCRLDLGKVDERILILLVCLAGQQLDVLHLAVPPEVVQQMLLGYAPVHPADIEVAGFHLIHLGYLAVILGLRCKDAAKRQRVSSQQSQGGGRPTSGGAR